MIQNPAIILSFPYDSEPFVYFKCPYNPKILFYFLIHDSELFLPLIYRYTTKSDNKLTLNHYFKHLTL